VLQCIAVCCSVLQCGAACVVRGRNGGCSSKSPRTPQQGRAPAASRCCSVLQCVAVRCGVLRCVAVCCSVLQCVAMCCNVCHVCVCVGGGRTRASWRAREREASRAAPRSCSRCRFFVSASAIASLCCMSSCCFAA